MWSTYIIAIIVVSCVRHPPLAAALWSCIISKFTLSSIIIYVGMTACFHIRHPPYSER